MKFKLVRMARYIYPSVMRCPCAQVCAFNMIKTLGRSPVVGVLGYLPLDMGSIPGAVMLDRNSLLAASEIHLITMVTVCPFGLARQKVMLNSLIHTYINMINVHVFLRYPPEVSTQRGNWAKQHNFWLW